eukprot:CAMPEP_0114233314 /NCGR_PEP_ID=MMETSP0058-20121206/5094_1 /TAXON_ID=36894 /ORGANISM="Pyramimonas parkeae, CCMP726" /LENGTH=311 /DNA_ID=CAMNT_0001344887 /DNA_START=733 /DNA_END=1669 /DNA_ORIENTATION=-
MCFLLFMAFSLCVEALHSLIEPESEHKHYLVLSSMTNLGVNLVGVLFFHQYARVRVAYRNSQDMNMHAIFLHVASDSVRSGGTVLSLWLLALGVPAAEAIVDVMMAAAVFGLALPLFQATSRTLLQGVPRTVERLALAKCLRDAGAGEGVLEVREPRFWELRPGALVGTLTVRVGREADEQRALRHVHSVFYNNLGPLNLTVQVGKLDKGCNKHTEKTLDGYFVSNVAPSPNCVDVAETETCQSTVYKLAVLYGQNECRRRNNTDVSSVYGSMSTLLSQDSIQKCYRRGGGGEHCFLRSGANDEKKRIGSS